MKQIEAIRDRRTNGVFRRFGTPAVAGVFVSSMRAVPKHAETSVSSETTRTGSTTRKCAKGKSGNVF